MPASFYFLFDRNVASFGTIGFGDKRDLLVRRLPIQMEIRDLRDRLNCIRHGIEILVLDQGMSLYTRHE